MMKDNKQIWECRDSEDSDLIHIGPENEMGIMEFCVTSVHDEGHANLIAAAPDMLEALDYFLDSLGDEHTIPSECIGKMIKAIEKAKGE